MGVPRKPALYGGPIDEFTQPSNITKSDAALRQERAGALQPERVVGEPVAPGTERVQPGEEPGREDMGGRAPLDTGRRALSGGEEAVQPELGRVPGVLEGKLSPEQRKAFAPEVEALRDASL